MKFNEEKHIYINDKGELYTSATSLIKKYHKPFERLKIATKYAKKHKLKVEDVLSDWEKTSNDALKKGTAFHKIKEDELNDKPHILIEDENHPIIKSSWIDGMKVSDNLKLEPGVYPELIVWSDKYKIAGQADYVEVTKKGYININDYKTSKEIKKNAFTKWDGTREMMNFPLHNLEDCNFNEYSLQINLYAFLVKQHNRNLKIGRLTIEHIIGNFDEETGTFTNLESVIYKVPNMQDEVKILLEHYKNKMN